MNRIDSTDIDLRSVELDGRWDVEALDEAAALSTWGSSSTASSMSCPVSSAGSAMTAMSAS